MHDQIGIASDRRSEVAVVLEPEREVAEVFFGVEGALHRPQDDVRQKPLLGRASHRFQNALQLAGADLLDVAAQLQLELRQDLAEVFEAARIGLLVHAKDSGLMRHHQLGGHHLVGGQHEFFDEAMRDVALGRLNRFDLPRLAEQHIGLGEIEVDGAARVTPRAQDLVEGVHALEVGEEIGVCRLRGSG